MGLKVGDIVERKSSVGPDKAWRIEEIKHRYLHTLHEILRTFEVRFPNRGLWGIQVSDHDITPILDEVRKHAERNRKRAELYFSNPLPLAAAAHVLGGNAVSFAAFVRSLDRDVATCQGSDAERNKAHVDIDQSRKNGAVLDGYTAWVASILGILDTLKDTFGNIFVPQSSIDELVEPNANQTPDGKESMSIAWDGKEFVRTILSPDQVERAANERDAIIEEIKRTVQVLPVDAPNDLTPLELQISETFGDQLLDPIYLAAERGCLLVSDDLRLRQIAAQTRQVSGVWLLATLRFAVVNKRIQIDRFSEAVGGLAEFRHAHVQLDVPVLWHLFKQSGADGRFAAAIEFLGTKNANMEAHVEVSASFLQILWRTVDVDKTSRDKATGLVIQKLIRHHGSSWSTILNALRMDAPWQMVDYINGWQRGHFLG
jgi:hypothetical protein